MSKQQKTKSRQQLEKSWTRMNNNLAAAKATIAVSPTARKVKEIRSTIKLKCSRAKERRETK